LVITTFFAYKKSLQVDLGDLKIDGEKLSNFLNSKFKLNVSCGQNKAIIDSEKTSLEELKHAVNKFIYHQNLNCQYWVSAKGKTVKINKFKNVKKPEKTRKNGTSPTFAHGF
jgi:hypothetical protein